MKLKLTAAIFIVLLVLGGLAGVKALQIKKMIAAGAAFKMPPETVSSAVARDEKWQGTLTAIGSITTVQGVMVTPDIPGTVREINFESGAVVAEGDLLVRLDTSTEEAQLRALEAQLGLAKLNVARERRLFEQKTVPQADLEVAEATLKQSEANADAVRATIEKKTLRAPFAGRLGIRLINLGQYLETAKPIVSLQSLTPIHADFSLPQQELARVTNGMRVRVTTDAYPGREFAGALTAINPEMDAVTRSVSLQATFDNADQALRPGMYARVEVMLPEERPVLVIPATSVLSAPFGDSVYVIESKPEKESGKSELAVRQQFIRTGATRGDFVVVESGLKAGERIVNSGLFKLRNGMSVVENNSLVPKSEKAPTPADG
jgi:membrane fusion protein (multidrug efflux system)